MTNKLELIKAGAEIVVSLGTGFIVGGVVKTNCPLGRNVLKNICVIAASLVLSDMACDKTTEYTDAKIDNIADQLKKAVVTEQNLEEEEWS